jgi:type IV secretion system protein VirB10
VNSPGVDKLGRAGEAGFVDSRFREIFSTAILTSVITIGVASAAEKVVGGDDTVTNTTNTDGTTSSSGSATAQATAQSISNIGGVAKRVLDNVIDTRPVITIDQGTKINVMVNRDLIFPNSVLQQTNFVE